MSLIFMKKQQAEQARRRQLACHNDKKKKKKPKDVMRAHLDGICDHLVEQLYLTHLEKSINIFNILADREYCIDAALRMSKSGNGSIAKMTEDNLTNPKALQREFAGRAVQIAVAAWEECHQLTNLKKKALTAAVKPKLKLSLETDPIHLETFNTTTAFVSSRTVTTVKSAQAFEHASLCPPVIPPTIRPPPPMRKLEEELPDLISDTPALTHHKHKEVVEEEMEEEEFALEDVDFGDDEDYFGNETRDSNAKIYKESVKNRPSTTPVHSDNFEPLTPQLNGKMELLSPIKNDADLARKLGVALNTRPFKAAPLKLVASPKAKQAPPKVSQPKIELADCSQALVWLQQLINKGLIEVPTGSTFLAFPNSELDICGFNKWRQNKSAEDVQLGQLSAIQRRLSTTNMRGIRKHELKTLAGTEFSIDEGFIFKDGKPTYRLTPNVHKMGELKILVLASSAPLVPA